MHSVEKQSNLCAALNLSLGCLCIAQLVEHYSANAEATGSSSVEAPKSFLSGLIRITLITIINAAVTSSFQLQLHMLRRLAHVPEVTKIFMS